MELDLSILLILAAVSLLAGFIDTLAGGGGLLTLPALMLAGLSPVQALATNKLQGTFGSGMAAFTLWRRRRFRIAEVRRAFLASLIGSALGTVLVQVMHTDILEILVPVVLVIIALYFLFSKGAGQVERAPRVSDKSMSAPWCRASAFMTVSSAPAPVPFSPWWKWHCAAAT